MPCPYGTVILMILEIQIFHGFDLELKTICSQLCVNKLLRVGMLRVFKHLIG
jgi:hypothetical protein